MKTALYFDKFVNPSAGVFLYTPYLPPANRTYGGGDPPHLFPNLTDSSTYSDFTINKIKGLDTGNNTMPNYGLFPSSLVRDQLHTTPLLGGDSRRGPNSLSMWVYMDIDEVKERLTHPQFRSAIGVENSNLKNHQENGRDIYSCLLYTSPSPRD